MNEHVVSYTEAINGVYPNQALQSRSNSGSPLEENSSIDQGLNGDTRTPDKSSKYSIPLNENLAYTPRKLRAITIGAGFSGLMMAHKFRYHFPEMERYISHTIFEARNEIGGTWLVNNYPGVQCDVPSHIYADILSAFPFDPNPDWTHFYSSGAEIQDYILRTARKWDLDRDVQLNTRVIAARWHTDLHKWVVTISHLGEERDELADFLISGQGILTHHKWPDIPGLNNYTGHKTHSAEWDHQYDYSHQRIAVIGNGSSGIQIVPQLRKLPGTTVTNFIRGPTWIYYRVAPAKHLGRDDKDSNPAYTEEDKIRFRQDPQQLKQHRKDMIARTNKAFQMFVKGSRSNEEAVQHATQQMSSKLDHRPDLCSKLIPTWEVGCRRVTPGPGYLESFLESNCHLTDSPITHVSDRAIHTADGKVHQTDVVVCATGFDVSYCPRYPVIGLNGINLQDKWASEPESYMSVAAADMPNYFICMGPNAVVGHGSLMEALNWTCDYICKWITKVATEDIRYVVPKRDAVEAFVRYADEIHKGLVWSGGCRSWYKNGTVDGRVTALFGGTAILFHKLISDIRAEDFEIAYGSENPFRFMGNGFTEYEIEEGNDLAWYVEN